MKLTVRLSKNDATIAQMLKEGHGLTGPVPNWGGISGSRLYYGISFSGPPSWAGFINSGMHPGITFGNNSGAVAILFIPLSDRYMVYSFGITSSKIKVIPFEKDFGLKVVLNAIDPERIKSVDSKFVDTMVVTKRTQTSKENKLANFDFQIDKDLLRNVVGKPLISSFATLMSGTDTLNISCDLTPGNLLQKSRQILQVYDSDNYKASFGWIDHVKSVKGAIKVNLLDQKLTEEFNKILQGETNDLFQLASPDIIDFESTSYFKISGYRSSTPFPLPDLENIIEDLARHNRTDISINSLKSYTIKSYDGNDAPGKSWELYEWLVAEVSINNLTYLISEGEWFEISREFYDRIESKFQQILQAPGEFLHMGSTSEVNEANYIASYTATDNEMVFDSNLSYTYGGANSIEVCDLYNSMKEFIHIKDGGSSGKLSHLFNQGYVSAITFLSDRDYVDDIRNKLISKPGLQSTIVAPVTPEHYTIVFRILKRGRSFRLPFFTKVVLADTYTRIKRMRYQFRLEWLKKN